MTLSLAWLCPGETIRSSKLPPIGVRPELYLGWHQKNKRPEIKRLPWLLKITIRGVSTDNQTIAGPLKINTREEFAGINFGQAELTVIPETAATNGAASDQNGAKGRIDLQSLDFATQVTHQGANLINLRCYVKLRVIHDQRVATYNTTATLECRPGRETVLAEFPSLKLLLTADWEGPVLIE